MMTTSIRPLVALALALVAAPSPGWAQQAPPAPLPLGEVDFPAFEERTLSNGARVLVVPQHEIPFVTVNLVLPAGGVSDSDGLEGTAGFTAELLTRGTTGRTREEIAEQVDFLGASLTAGASDDWLTVSLAAVTAALPDGLDLMADITMNPSFPADEVELLRTRALSGLQVELTQAPTLAERAFTRHVYRSHAYGRLQTPETVRAITREAVIEHHVRGFTPDEALFVIAGDLEVDEAVALLEEAFGEWAPHPVPEREYGAAPGRVQPEVVLVHRPGAPQAEVRAGHLLPAGAIEDWTALTVANQVLGGSSSARLFRTLREERGYTYGASSNVARRLDRGVFTAGMAVRNEVVGEAVGAMVGLIEEIRTRPIPAAELQDTKDFLIGSFPLQIETPQQVASQVTSIRLLGLPAGEIEGFRERVAALDAGAVQAAAREYLRPQELLIVVVGDATALRSQLTPFGNVRVEDAEGNPMTLADLEPQDPSLALDASGLEPDTLSYTMLVQGQALGTAVRSLTRPEPGHLRFASHVEAGPQTIDQDVVFTDAFRLVSIGTRIVAGPQTLTIEARREGDRLIGAMSLSGQEQAIDMAVPEGVVVSDMVEMALWVADLEVGREIRLPAAVLQSGSVENVRLSVVEETEVTVPAGTFPAYRVEMTGTEAQTFWVRVEAPHIVLRLQAAGQPLVLELTEGVGGG